MKWNEIVKSNNEYIKGFVDRKTMCEIIIGGSGNVHERLIGYIVKIWLITPRTISRTENTTFSFNDQTTNTNEKL